MLLTRIKLLVGSALVGVLVALTYFLFESAVSHSTDYIWNTLLSTGTVRILVLPVCVVLSVLFFGIQQWLDPGSQNHEAHSLGGEAIKPTIRNLAIIISVGFLSLLAGASLGPEAILVPSSVLIGSYIGLKLYKKDSQVPGLLAGAATMALMTAFFHSFWVGVLTVLLVAKQSKAKINLLLLVIAVVASASSYFTLQVIDPAHRYFSFPDFSWKLALLDLGVGLLLIVAGYAATFALKYAHVAILRLRSAAKLTSWWKLAIFASFGLSLLYLLGGPLVEFTGNHSIAPLFSQSSTLGLLGLLGVLVVKIGVIAWSRAMGYRGGLIFPMIFVASVLTSIGQLAFAEINIAVGIVAALIGIFAAEAKAKVLL